MAFSNTFTGPLNASNESRYGTQKIITVNIKPADGWSLVRHSKPGQSAGGVQFPDGYRMAHSFEVVVSEDYEIGAAVIINTRKGMVDCPDSHYLVKNKHIVGTFK